MIGHILRSSKASVCRVCIITKNESRSVKNAKLRLTLWELFLCNCNVCVQQDYIDTEMLLSSENVNQEALLCYAREAADFGTNYQLPTLDFAMNHCGQPDVAMFDFTCMYASENAALVRERFGHQLLEALVGDSLVEVRVFREVAGFRGAWCRGEEAVTKPGRSNNAFFLKPWSHKMTLLCLLCVLVQPFWPMGTGCARGFLAAFDSAWMVKSWAQGRTALEVLAERYTHTPQDYAHSVHMSF